jgi:hypothetical protein
MQTAAPFLTSGTCPLPSDNVELRKPCMMSLAVFGGTIVLAVGFSMPGFAETVADASSGYAIPLYGEDVEIINTYQAPDGHFVFDFWYKGNGRLKEDFYDTAVRDRLFKNQESSIANDDAVHDALVKKRRLIKISPALYSVQLSDNTKAHDSYTDGRTCHWPYVNALAVGTQDIPFVQESVFMPLDRPRTKNYRRDCEEASGMAALTVKYRNGVGEFIADRDGGFWAIISESRYAIHFDRDGKSGFFDGRNDIVLVPAGQLIKLRDQADKSRQNQQSFLDRQEDIIDSALRDQVEAK